MTQPRWIAWGALAVATLLPSVAGAADRSLADYRYFRALSIDLLGRIPTRAEVVQFEAHDFDENAWIDQQLDGPGYVDRVERIYVDALKLEVGGTFLFGARSSFLHRYAVPVREANGSTHKVWVYYRTGQRRATPATDRSFCFTAADTGQTYPRNRAPDPEEPTKVVTRAVFDARTAKVRPYWLYSDYRLPSPTNHYTSFQATQPRFLLDLPGDPTGPATTSGDVRLLVNADGTATTDVYVCNEEAQETKTVSMTFEGATVNVPCTSALAADTSSACGCGRGLEGCVVGAGFATEPRGVAIGTFAPIGGAEPLEITRQGPSAFWRQAWTEEAREFLRGIFREDRDFREVLTARYGYMNGPVAQFYRSLIGYDYREFAPLGNYAPTKPDAIVDPAKVPAALLPHEMDRWVKVPDRGPHAAGLLTMPAFLAKYGTRRGRAHAVYNTFLCKDFVADQVSLPPSDEPNLMIRPGCSTCHARLEPMAAYFTRTKESSFAWIPSPLTGTECALPLTAANMVACRKFHNPDFSTTAHGSLRGSYASPANAAAGPRGLAAEVTGAPEFDPCVAKTVAEGMLGRALVDADAPALGEFSSVLTGGGHRVRALVRAQS